MHQQKNSSSLYLEKLTYDPSLEKSLFSVFLDRSRFLIMVLVIIGLAGFISLKGLSLESNPEVKIGMAVVSVSLPGASPEIIEDQVVKRLEKQIAKVKGIDTINSSANNSFGSIMVQFRSDVDIPTAMRDLKDQVDVAKSDLPSDTKEPVVKEISFDDTPVWTFAVAGKYDGFQLRNYAKKIADEIEKDPLVSDVNISGGDQVEYSVLVNPSKLEQYGITLTQLNQALAARNISLPIGEMRVGDSVHKMTVDERFFSVQEIGDIAITKMGNFGVVRVRDVADVRETAVKKTTISRMSSHGSEPNNAVSLGVVKRRGGSILDLVSHGQKAIDDLFVAGVLPKDVQIITIIDTSERIRLDLSHLVRDGLITFALVFIVLLVFTGLRPALVASTTVPLVFFITFVVMKMAGQTLNFLSMFALILSLGLLVDDAIVVVTAINQYLKTGRFSAKQAALLVLRDYKRVLTSTTLTVVWVFSAMLFMTGLIGKFIFSIPFVITVTLLASLFIALTINPALSVIVEGKHDNRRLADGGHKHEDMENWKQRLVHTGLIHFAKIEDWYAHLLERLIQDRRSAWRFVGMITALFFASFLLPILGILKTDFFPATDQDIVFVNIELDPGTNLQVTSKAVAQVESLLVQEKEIASFVTTIGQQVVIGKSTGGSTVGENYAGISINLKKKEYGRKESSLSIADRLRARVKNFSDMNVRVEELKSGPPAGADFELKIAGENAATLESIALDVQKILQTIPGVVNIGTSRKPLPLEFDFSFDPARLALYDLTLPQVAWFLRNSIDGTEATSVYKGDDKITVRTRYAPDLVSSLENMKNLKVTNLRGQPVFIRDILSSSLKSSVFSISRTDQKRILSVTAGASKSTNGAAIMRAFLQKSKDYKLPSGYEFITGGANEENAKSVFSLFTAMGFGMLLIIATLVILYDSFLQSIIVLVTIPFSLIGVFWGLTIFGQPLSFPGMIGLVALFGIVVRNGIIFFDKINQNRAEGFSIHDSIIDAGRTRLEPELLTSLCTILGMLPLTFSNPTWTSLGLSIMFGLLASTLLTLRVLPGLYFLLIKEENKKA